jgi:hypothetical protein
VKPFWHYLHIPGNSVCGFMMIANGQANAVVTALVVVFASRT